MKYINRQGNIVEKKDDVNEFLKIVYKNKYYAFFLSLFTGKRVSELGAKFLKSKYSIPLIRKFVVANNIDMSVYQKQRYQSYNDFFIRKIKPEYRKFSQDKELLCSPCDGKLQVFDISDDSKFVIKNSVYTLESLLRNEELSNEFSGGKIAIFRLSVDNYHRYSYVDNGLKSLNVHIDGSYYSVDPVVIENVRVFKENTREYCIIETENFGKIIQMEVGATLVGKITNLHGRKMVKRGEEKGYFEFGGSTIIMIFKDNTINFDSRYLNSEYEIEVFMGDEIGRVN